MLRFDLAGDLVASVGSPLFGEALMRIGQSVVDADYSTLFAFAGTAEPTCLVATGVRSRSAALRASRQYVDRYWRADPSLRDPADECRVHHVFSSQIAPAYRRECYDIPQIGDRLTLLFQDRGRMFRMSFYRKHTRQSFSDGDMEHLRSAGPMFREAAKRHHSLSCRFGVDASTGRPSLRLMADRLAALERGLSHREIAVCARILTGMTSEAISTDLGIGLTSVVTYRRRAYTKLGISSQNELFARCLVH